MQQCKSLILAFGLLGSSASVTAQSNPVHPSTYYEQQVSLFRMLPTRVGSIIFLGNSITDGGEWQELFPDKLILNRGISGDNTYGVLLRLDEVIRHKPSKVFLLIGTNDLNQGTAPEVVRDNILQIVSRLRIGSPSTKVYVQSIFPVNGGYGMFSGHTKNGEQIKQINSDLKALASQSGYTYIDVYSALADDAGQLKATYTNDGLHLLGQGYQVWRDILLAYMKP